ncbi:MAG TPA: helicase RepA family protein [Phycisphaerae bacterium]|nr:helicase RepA family protein [Phycisphaerae bacterium]
MVTINEQDIVREYDDGAGWPVNNRAKEQAYRRGFVEEARRIVRDWAHPPEPRNAKPGPGPVSVRELLDSRRCDPFGEVEAAWQLRRRVRERFTVYGPGDAGRKTYHLGYRPGHAVAAARLRGRNHAMAFVTNLWEDLETADLDIFDPRLLCPWLRAVEQWASAPIRPNVIVPPPHPMEVAPPEEFVHAEPDDEPALPPPTQGNLVTPPTPAPPPPPRIRLTRADQIEMRPPHWLLRGMLERDTFALIFGDPGCGKSFLAIDWACRVATGTPWRGHDVRSGPVVYVAGEGQQGFGRRIRAWSEHHGVSLADMPLYLAPAVAIPSATDLVALVTAIDAGVTALLGEPILIVLDTLARCFGGGDENSTQDMSRFVSACDAIRQRYSCTILVVHHAGHGDKSRARGAIALKAALDAEYRLANDTGLLLTATKMKDAEMPPPLALELVTVELPGAVDDYGNLVTSAAIEVLDADTSAIVAKANAAMSGRRGKWQKMGLEIAKRLIGEGDDGQAGVADWHTACETAGMRQSTRYSVLAKLHDRGVINVDGDTMSIP